jgi:hypothetical protein
MLIAATAGNRFSRSGGDEYAAPTNRPARTAASSIGPWVIAITAALIAVAPTISFAAARLSSPAASGRSGLLTRSMSTSSI